MALPKIYGTGNIVADPELRYTNDGKAMLNLRIAFNRSKKLDNGQWDTVDSVFLSATVFDNRAEQLASLSKGDKVNVQGDLRQREYETKQGEKRVSYEVVFPVVELVAKPQGGQQNGGQFGGQQGGQQGGQRQSFAPAGDEAPPF